MNRLEEDRYNFAIRMLERNRICIEAAHNQGFFNGFVYSSREECWIRIKED